MESSNFVVKASISDVYVKPKNKFRIPRFQRQYAWEEEQVSDFWKTINSYKATFLGTIIFDVKDKKELNVIEIVDGQQRYLTIQILGAALRNYAFKRFEETGNREFDKISKGINVKLIGSPDDYDYDDGTLDYYLTPGDSIKDFFLKYIQDKEGKNLDLSGIMKKTEEERVKNAYIELYKCIKNEVEINNEKDQVKWLKEFIDSKLGIHFFVKIEIAEEGLAYEVFEAVNAKGVDLSVADLIKNQIFKHVVGSGNDDLDEAKKSWTYILEILSDNDFSIKDYISYYWSSKYRYESDKNLYQAIIKKFGNDEFLWKTFLKDLVDNVEYLNVILNGSYDNILSYTREDKKEAQKLYQNLRVLRSIKAKTWIILYLSLFRNFLVNDTVMIKLNTKWTIIEKFTFMYFHILNLPGNWYFKTICNFCEKIESIEEDKYTNKYLSKMFTDNMFKHFSDKIPRDDKEFKEGFTSIVYKDDERSRTIIRYVLSEIEEKLVGKHNEGYNEDKVNIEHLLPQNPKQWGLTKKDIKEYVNRIGNLMLLGIKVNGELGDKKIDEKLDILRNHSTSLQMVKDFVTQCDSKYIDFKLIETRKDFSAITIRTNDFSEIAYSIWCIELKKSMGF
ncbi:DUF262 domain-containing HNH endonuclease family protein [Myroides odoratimimus]|uniref:DUF262 domain-containing protein n=1 Tax=Myroides odoratimimus TaxID=76832 RepID=UPI00310193FF